MEKTKHKILRDTQEKKGFWDFAKSEYCAGTVPQSLETGDYCIEGMEGIFSIERKASTGELAGNIYTKRFANELKRGDNLKHFFVICEFSISDLLNFPYGSGIPGRYWKKLRVTPKSFLKKIIEFETTYNVKFLFCDNTENAKEVAIAIFKRMIEQHAQEINAV